MGAQTGRGVGGGGQHLETLCVHVWCACACTSTCACGWLARNMLGTGEQSPIVLSRHRLLGALDCRGRLMMPGLHGTHTLCPPRLPNPPHPAAPAQGERRDDQGAQVRQARHMPQRRNQVRARSYLMVPERAPAFTWGWPRPLGHPSCPVAARMSAHAHACAHPPTHPAAPRPATSHPTPPRPLTAAAS